ncbi:MAG TPA: D-aminoacylase [Armatimonadota bacterium]|jgi:N-acyl-D-amino-acid deacylase
MAEELELILAGGTVVDGTGAHARRADVGLRAGRIAEVGNLTGAQAARAVPVEGLVVAPGFIDMHSHTDYCYLANPTAESKLTQGVTTEIGGNCGVSGAPLLGPFGHSEEAKRLRDLGIGARWTSLAEMGETLQSRGMAVNFATFVGHGNLRKAVLGYDNRAPDSEELGRMRSLAEQAMEEGALGISTGLIYPPGCYSDTEELIALAAAVAPKGGLYATHMRNEGELLLESVQEALRIGRESGAPVQISHHKACGPPSWGLVKTSLRMIDEALSEGVRVGADQYPYIATSTDLCALLPQWFHEGGSERAMERLNDPATLDRLRAEMLTDGKLRHGASFDKILITQTHPDSNRWAEGLSLDRIAQEWGIDPLEAIFRLLRDADLDVGMCNFLMCEEDVERVMRHPRVCVGSDGVALCSEGALGRGKPHPRAYGTFPRVLGHYGRERGVLSLEEAVHKMTGLTAELLGFTDRGLLKPGLAADITVFDPETVQDRATFTDPRLPAEGIHLVIVNGQIAFESGRPTGALPGQFLKGGSLGR